MSPESFLPPTLRLYTPDTALVLADGAVLERPAIGYQSWGRLNARRDNVIWVCHALTASTDVPAWWPALFGPGRALDPERYFIICANVLGGCYGSLGPRSDRGDGRAFGGDFPSLQIEDLVAHQRLLLEHLDLRGIELVIGGSMGGFQALEWALQEPNRVRRLALVASSWRQPADAVALAELQCALVRQDPAFADGHYGTHAGPVRGLALARQLGHYSYRASDEFEQRFGRARREDGRLQVLSYLDHQGNKLVQRFDANSYLRLSTAMNHFDLGASAPIERVLGRIHASTLVVAIDTDRLYPPREQIELARMLPNARLLQVHSDRGHDGFLADAQSFEPALRELLAPPPRALSPRPAATTALRRPLALIGATGRVGAALLQLLQPQPDRYRLVAVANRRGALFQGDGLRPEGSAAQLQTASSLLPLAALGAVLPPGTVLIDATAAASVAGLYPSWLAQGHALVAANKLAFAGDGWATLANNLSRIGCSGVVGAGLPILRSVRRLREAGDQLLAVEATLSGTLGYVLDQLQQDQELADSVASAVDLGLAEPDPAADLSGEDVARKLLVVLRLAGYQIDREQIELTPLLPPRGASQSVADWLAKASQPWRERIDRARAQGQRWVYRAHFDGARAVVAPVALPLEHELARCRGAANRALLYSAFHGDQPLLIGGNGAGPKVTAAALLADIAELGPAEQPGRCGACGATQDGTVEPLSRRARTDHRGGQGDGPLVRTAAAG
jgi:homoserine O-acetyltransferase